jgi:glycosyltransferase involved in cell wall biosynthesis
MTSTGGMRRGALALLKIVGRMSATSLYPRISAWVPKSLKARTHRMLLGVAAGRPQELISALGESGGQDVVQPQSTRARPHMDTSGSESHGVNVIGYVRGGLGLAENVRSFARALQAKGFPIALVDANILGADRNTDDSLVGDLDQDARFEIDVFFVNPDHLSAAMSALHGSRARYRIGYWFWELEAVPEEWLPAIDLVDEIWVSSEFVRAAFARVTNKPVTLIPMAVEVDTGQLSPRIAREGGVFTFLFSFDFHSYVERKNPAAVIDAFVRAFPVGRDDVRLIIKSTNGDVFRNQYYALMSKASQDKRIVVTDGFVRRRQMVELVNRADAYVSLHRSEGFGLGLAESMYLGKAVIGTGYSGNLEFMTADNSCLTDFEMTEVKPGDYVHGEGQQWANANIEDAAQYMRRLVDDVGYAETLGMRAAQDIRAQHSHERCSDVAIQRLHEIHRLLGLGGVAAGRSME